MAAMLLDEIARTSEEVAATSARNRKTELIADSLRALASRGGAGRGRLPRRRAAAGLGRRGLGVRCASLPSPAPEPTLELLDVDAAIGRIASVVGEGIAGAPAAGGRGSSSAARPSASSGSCGAPARRAAAGRARGRDGRRGREGRRACRPPRSAARRCSPATSRRGRGGRARRRRARARPLPPDAAPAGEADARADGRGPRERAREAEPAGRGRVEARRRAAPGAPARRRGRARTRGTSPTSPSACPRSSRRCSRSRSTSLVLDGEAIALKDDGTPHRFQVTMSRFGSGSEAASRDAGAAVGALLRLPPRRRRGRPRPAARERLRDPRASASRTRTGCRRLVADDAGRSGARARRRARARARGRDGQGARRALRGRAPRRAAGSSSSPRTRSTSSCSPPSGATAGARASSRTSTSARATRRRAGFVMLGKTFKGMTDAMLAWQTERLLELEDATRRPHRPRAAGARRRDRVRRRAGEPPLSRAASRSASRA